MLGWRGLRDDVRVRVWVAAVAVVVVAALAGCGGSPGRVPLAACPSGEPRAQESAGGPWVCDPDAPVTPAAAPVVTSAAAPVAVLSFTCSIFQPPAPSSPEQFIVTAANPGSVTADSFSINVAFYDAGGQETGSDTGVVFAESITAGNSVTVNIDQRDDEPVPAGSSSCTVTGWG